MIADWQRNNVHKSLISNAIFLPLLFLLWGCATPAPSQFTDQVFSANGKFGIKDAQSGYSASFSWRHFTQGYDIEVWGPLGQGRTRLYGDSRHMQISRGARLLDQGLPEAVMLYHLGWSVPIDVLPAWIQGLPAPELPYEHSSKDAQGRYTGFTQAGWEVSLERYAERTSAQSPSFTPARLVAMSGTRKVTVVVREFSQ